MAGQVYDPREVTIVAGGSSLVGLSPDTFVKIAIESGQYEDYPDLYGNYVRVLKSGVRAVVTITLTAFSSSNDVLSSFYIADTKNAGRFPLMIKNNSGSTLFTCPDAYVAKYSDIELSGGSTNNEWDIICFNPTLFAGGLNK